MGLRRGVLPRPLGDRVFGAWRIGPSGGETRARERGARACTRTPTRSLASQAGRPLHWDTRRVSGGTRVVRGGGQAGGMTILGRTTDGVEITCVAGSLRWVGAQPRGAREKYFPSKDRPFAGLLKHEKGIRQRPGKRSQAKWRCSMLSFHPLAPCEAALAGAMVAGLNDVVRRHPHCPHMGGRSTYYQWGERDTDSRCLLKLASGALSRVARTPPRAAIGATGMVLCDDAESAVYSP